MPRRVVVVDDDASLLDLFTEVLTDDGYAPVPCQDGAAALAVIRDTAPALVMMDMRLDTPERGWRIIEALQADPVLARTPLIITTADRASLQHHGDDLTRAGYALLAKPFPLSELRTLVRQLAGPPDGADEAVSAVALPRPPSY